MSVSAISSSTLAASVNQSIQNKLQQFRQEFQQLGSDLQSGNLSAAQQDVCTAGPRVPKQLNLAQRKQQSHCASLQPAHAGSAGGKYRRCAAGLRQPETGPSEGRSGTRQSSPSRARLQ